MSISSDGVEVGDSWRVDLEIALLEDADYFRIRTICANRPVPANTRAEVWRICLQPDLQGHGMTDFRNVFELVNQHELHTDCKQAAQEAIGFLSAQSSEHATRLRISESDDDSGNNDPGSPLTDEDKFDFGRETELDQQSPLPSLVQLTSDFESVITHFAETYSLTYSSDNGWVSILKLLYCTIKPVDKHDLYACFSSVFHRFIPNGPDVDHRVCHVLRLLFQYHEPELFNFLESLKVTPTLYAKSWLFSLFSSAIPYSTLVALWDVYFLMSDPLLGFYIVLVLLINAKTSLMGTAEDEEDASHGVDETAEHKSRQNNSISKDTILQTLLDLPKPMEPDDVTSLVELTQLYASRTPSSFRMEFLSFLFGNTVLDAENGRSVPCAAHLCMPVTVQEVLEAQAVALNYASGVAADVPNEFKPSVRFLLVDCRPADQYNAGHLNTAFFIDSQLLLSDPDSFRTTVEALLLSQKRALNAGSHAAGEHITFLSSGRPEEDQITNMVVAAFLRLNTPYVSLIKGGYVALHETLGPQQISRSLVSHNSKECLCCQSQSSKKENTVVGLFKSGTRNIGKELSTTKQPVSSTVTPRSIGGFFSKISGTLFKGTGAVESKKTAVNTRHPGDTADATATSDHEIQAIVTEVKRPQAQNERSASYRNTASVFSIDDEEDVDDDFSLSFDDSNGVGNSESAEPPSTPKNSTRPKNTSWLRRLTAAIHVTETDLPAGDIPSRPGGLDSCEPGDLIDTTQWSSRSELHGVFDCQIINAGGRLTEAGYLVLAERHLVVLRDHLPRSPARLIASIGSAVQSALSRGWTPSMESGKVTSRARHAVVLRSAPLALITRITSNRRIPECITFHYSGKDPADLLLINEPVMGIRDRLYLPQAGEAVRMIKLAICHVTMA